MDVSKYKRLYLQTARDYLNQARIDLDRLSAHGPEDLINSLYIAIHSLKSQSLAMGYKSTGYLAGVLEFAFRDIKEKKKTFNAEIYANTREALEAIAYSLDSIEKNDAERDESKITNRIKETLGIKTDF